jgi:predicted dehydrogenase
MPLLVGLIGAGMISAFHLCAWRKLDAAEVATVVDPDEAAQGGAAGSSRYRRPTRTPKSPCDADGWTRSTSPRRA